MEAGASSAKGERTDGRDASRGSWANVRSCPVTSPASTDASVTSPSSTSVTGDPWRSLLKGVAYAGPPHDDGAASGAAESAQVRLLQGRLVVRPADRAASRWQRGCRLPAAVYCWRYRSSMMPRPCWAIAASAGACWMEVKAYIWRLRIRAMAASTAATSATGTTTDTVRWSPMTRAAVIEKISTPTAKASPTCTHQRSPCSIGRPVAGERRVRRRAGTSVSRPPHRQHLVGHEMPSGLATKDRWAQDSSLGAVTASV